MKSIIAFVTIITMIFLSSCDGVDEYDILDMGNKYYETVEELHKDYVITKEYAYNNSGDTSPYNTRDIVQYFEDSDVVIVICTYAHSPTDEIYKDSLYIYFIEKTENGYHLEMPSLGVYNLSWAELPFSEDYSNSSVYLWPGSQYHNKCYGFAYKSIDETRSLYFDGNKMKEIECINPFTNEPFILCYSDEGKFYSLFEKLFVPQHKRHTLEIK